MKPLPRGLSCWWKEPERGHVLQDLWGLPRGLLIANPGDQGVGQRGGLQCHREVVFKLGSTLKLLGRLLNTCTGFSFRFNWAGVWSEFPDLGTLLQ